MEKVKNKLHFAGSFYVDETSNGGGFWRNVNMV